MEVNDAENGQGLPSAWIGDVDATNNDGTLQADLHCTDPCDPEDRQGARNDNGNSALEEPRTQANGSRFGDSIQSSSPSNISPSENNQCTTTDSNDHTDDDDDIKNCSIREFVNQMEKNLDKEVEDMPDLQSRRMGDEIREESYMTSPAFSADCDELSYCSLKREMAQVNEAFLRRSPNQFQYRQNGENGEDAIQVLQIKIEELGKCMIAREELTRQIFELASALTDKLTGKVLQDKLDSLSYDFEHRKKEENDKLKKEHEIGVLKSRLKKLNERWWELTAENNNKLKKGQILEKEGQEASVQFCDVRTITNLVRDLESQREMIKQLQEERMETRNFFDIMNKRMEELEEQLENKNAT